MDDLDNNNTPSKYSSAKKRRDSPMKGNEEENLVNAIKDLISIEMDLEKNK